MFLELDPRPCMQCFYPQSMPLQLQHLFLSETEFLAEYIYIYLHASYGVKRQAERVCIAFVCITRYEAYLNPISQIAGDAPSSPQKHVSFWV